MPKVSIVIPVYNNENYVVECVDSALAQTLSDLEIICVDDGSTDGSGAILDAYAEKDSRVKVIHNPNSGYGHSMNTGLDQASGEYFFILESDDCLKPNAIEELAACADKHRLDFVKSDYEVFVGEPGDRTYTYMETCRQKHQYYKLIDPSKNLDVLNERMNTWTGLYRISFLNMYHIRHNETPGASYQDNGFWFQTFLWAHRVMFMDRAFYQLRRDNPNSSVHNRGKVFCIFDEYAFVEKIVRSDPEKERLFIRMFHKKKFDNCLFHFTRIGDEFKMDFLRRMSDEFKKARADGEIDLNLYVGTGRENVQLIMDNPQKFYDDNVLAVQNPEGKEAQILVLTNQLNAARKEIEGLQESASYRLGRGLTWLPRKTVGGIRCLKENGLDYTVRHFLDKVKGKV